MTFPLPTRSRRARRAAQHAAQDRALSAALASPTPDPHYVLRMQGWWYRPADTVSTSSSNPASVSASATGTSEQQQQQQQQRSQAQCEAVREVPARKGVPFHGQLAMPRPESPGVKAKVLRPDVEVKEEGGKFRLEEPSKLVRASGVESRRRRMEGNRWSVTESEASGGEGEYGEDEVQICEVEVVKATSGIINGEVGSRVVKRGRR